MYNEVADEPKHYCFVKCGPAQPNSTGPAHIRDPFGQMLGVGYWQSNHRIKPNNYFLLGQIKPNNINFVVGDRFAGGHPRDPAAPPVHPTPEPRNPIQRLEITAPRQRGNDNPQLFVDLFLKKLFVDFYLKKLCVDYFSSKL